MAPQFKSLPSSELGPVPEAVDSLRNARNQFAHQRAQLLYRVDDEIGLAEATRELLNVIKQLLRADYEVPTTLKFTGEPAPEMLPGTLPPFVARHADKLHALAATYGYRIDGHPVLRDHARLYSYWGEDCDFLLDSLGETDGEQQA